MNRTVLSLILIAAILAGILLLPGCVQKASAFVIAAPIHPEMAPYPDESEYTGLTGFDDEGFYEAYSAWSEDVRAQYRPAGYADALDGFFSRSIPVLLSGAGEENMACSPLNLCLALGMLAELAGGESRQEVLDALGVADLETMRQLSSDLWNSNYRQDGATTSVLASSLWLNENVEFKADTLERLAEVYYAASYRGEMGSAEFDRALQNWLNENTGGMLSEQAGNVTLDPRTVMALAATLHFRSKWSHTFSEALTESGTFHAPVGDVTCDFMRQGGTGTYYWGERFTAVARPLEGGGAMWFFLPDEGNTPADLLAHPETMELLLTPGDWAQQKHLIIHQTIPKFDISSSLDLKESLAALGVERVMDPALADFSPMTEQVEPIWLDKADHAVRVAIDEEGVAAAAYTVMAMAGAGAPPEDEVDFTVDRPFLFAVTGRDGVPLFAGVVNQI